MKRNLIAITLASAIALTSATATPARALSDEQIGQLIGGALTLFVIGKALENSDLLKAQKTEKRPRVTRDYDRGPIRREWAGKKKYRDHTFLPAECLRLTRTNSGQHRYFNDNCLRKTYAFHKQLPKRCEIRLRSERGSGKAFDAQCLRQRGYRIAWN